MNAVIHPGLLRGGVRVPPSKSVAHRVLIAAALADAPTEIEISALNEDILATIGCLRALMEAGVSIPDRVRVIGHDDMLFARYNLKRLSSVRDPIDEFCDLTIESMVQMMDGKTPEQNHYVLKGSVVERETT